MSSEDPDTQAPIRDHRRQWRRRLYVYPVISRRSKGVSIGVNLNPDKRCNFACAYCQIDRRVRRSLHTVDVETLGQELDLAVGEVVAGRLWQEDRFAATAPEMRRLNDIAFSGDGEPTCVGELPAAVRAAADTRKRFALDELKLILITNASRLNDAPFREARAILDANNGEIWAKLDAGTEARFQRINHPLPPVTLEIILASILGLAAARPIVIQTLLCRLDGAPPPEDEIAAYCSRLRELIADGGQIKLVQLHTIARSPMSSSVATLGDADLDAIATRVRPAIAPVPVEVYYGQDVQPQKTV